jgi:hypothetical protein
VGHEALVRALSFDAGSGRLVSASYDKSVSGILLSLFSLSLAFAFAWISFFSRQKRGYTHMRFETKYFCFFVL